MKTILWMPRAEDDLAAIHAYISADSSLRAEHALRKILSAVDRLQDFPESGRLVPELPTRDVREIFVYSFRILYVIRQDEVHILTVHHGARLLGAEWEGP